MSNALQDFNLTVWRIPHKGAGLLVDVDAGLALEGELAGSWQSFTPLSLALAMPQLDPDSPSDRFALSHAHLLALEQLTRHTTALLERPERLGGAIVGDWCGLRLSAGDRSANFNWRGEPPEGLRSLDNRVWALAKSQSRGVPLLDIECATASTPAAFWAAYVQAVQPEGAASFGRNLDAFSDALAGGPGWPGACVLHLRHAHTLRQHAAFVSQLLEIAAASDAVELFID